MKQIICSIEGINYKLEYHKITTNDGSHVYEGILFQNPPLIFSLAISKNSGIKFSPLQTMPIIQDAIKRSIEAEEKIDTSNYC